MSEAKSCKTCCFGIFRDAKPYDPDASPYQPQRPGITCRRFPTFADHGPSDWCGEYSAGEGK